jgi:hypothetical protein
VPFFVSHRFHAAPNHCVSGVRVPAKIVPAVTEVRFAHWAHTRDPSPRLAGQERVDPHPGHTNPSPQRSRSR